MFPFFFFFQLLTPNLSDYHSHGIAYCKFDYAMLTQWAPLGCEDGEPTVMMMTSLPRVFWPGDKPLTTLQKLLGDVTKFTFA